MTAVAVPYPALTSADPKLQWLIPTLLDQLRSPERLAGLATAEAEPTGIADDPAEGVAVAGRTIDSGSAARTLERLRSASRA